MTRLRSLLDEKEKRKGDMISPFLFSFFLNERCKLSS